MCVSITSRIPCRERASIRREGFRGVLIFFSFFVLLFVLALEWSSLAISPTARKSYRRWAMFCNITLDQITSQSVLVRGISAFLTLKVGRRLNLPTLSMVLMDGVVPLLS